MTQVVFALVWSKSHVFNQQAHGATLVSLYVFHPNGVSQREVRFLKEKRRMNGTLRNIIFPISSSVAHLTVAMTRAKRHL